MTYRASCFKLSIFTISLFWSTSYRILTLHNFNMLIFDRISNYDLLSFRLISNFIWNRVSGQEYGNAYVSDLVRILPKLVKWKRRGLFVSLDFILYGTPGMIRTCGLRIRRAGIFKLKNVVISTNRQMLSCFCQSKIMWRHGKYSFANPPHNFELRPTIDISASKLSACLESDGFAGPIFPLQKFTKKK
jgi:hypothetical protein